MLWIAYTTYSPKYESLLRYVGLQHTYVLCIHRCCMMHATCNKQSAIIPPHFIWIYHVRKLFLTDSTDFTDIVESKQNLLLKMIKCEIGQFNMRSNESFRHANMLENKSDFVSWFILHKKMNFVSVCKECEDFNHRFLYT